MQRHTIKERKQSQLCTPISLNYYYFSIMKKANWKTIIQFIITVLTAIASSFLTQSCMN